jgi:hypothetical protein
VYALWRSKSEGTWTEGGQEMTVRRRYRWRYRRLIFGLILYWLVATGGAGIAARMRSSTSLDAGFVTFVMLVSLIVCMATERGQWGAWKRIAFVPAGWILQLIMSIPMVLVVATMMAGTSSVHLGERAVAFSSSLPSVILAMRRSRLFVVRRMPSESETSPPRPME